MVTILNLSQRLLEANVQLINLKNKKSQTKLKYDIQSKPKNVNGKRFNLKQQNQKQTNNTKTHFKGKGTINKLPIVCDVERYVHSFEKKQQELWTFVE